MAEHEATLFDTGRNAWRVAPADRAAFLVDADEYFKAFVAAARRARRSILIAGWDFHSRTRLLCRHVEGCELELGVFLNELVRRERRLEVRILVWDYPMLFGFDREWGPLYGLGWQPHRRVQFRYDNTHPIGGSHHQKIVVIDDVVAFNGGIDLTSRRWDTCDHAPDNEHRVLKGTPYPPFHDLAMVVEGGAARSLGDLVRERWRRATGDTLEPVGNHQGFFRRAPRQQQATSRWPESVTTFVRDVEVAISRTEPAVGGAPGIREIEALYLDMIAAARTSIYIENQYFTADRIGAALAARLQEPEGPEVILVLRELSHGWLEEVTMQTLRTRLIGQLHAADLHDRFRVCYPYIAGLKTGTCIDVHSKMMIIDDEILRIGSANLANRSMGLDTECDLTLHAGGREDVSEAICALRSQLLAEHLGSTPQHVRAAVVEAGSIRGAMARLQREDRTLRPLALAQVSETVLNVASVADPEKPVGLSDLARLLESDSDAGAEPDDPDMPAPSDPQALSEDIQRAPSWGTLALIVAGVLALAAAWNLTPLAGFLDGSRIVGWARRVGDQWWVPLATILAYTPAALTMFPRPLITLFAVIAFGPIMGFAYAMLGIELSAWVTFVAGRRLDHGTVRRVAGRKLSDILQVLRRRGLLAITALRLVPLAPFAVEGVVAGAARVKLWHFMLGTAIGILPGTLTSTVFGDQLRTWLDDPRRINYWLIAAVLLVLGVATWAVQRWLTSSLSASRHGVGDTGTR